VELHARGTCVISVDGERAVRLCDGERWVVPAGARAVRYLAVAGGLDVPVVAGSRSTLAVARFGGFEGRGLRHGDELGVAPAANSGGGPTNLAVERAEAPSVVDDEALVLSPGPHAGQVPGAFEHLLATQWRVSPWVDRVGMRLEGERRASTTSVRPTALTRGAVQWTPDGTPIVLGPDHPITGGYPIVAVVEPESLSALAERRPGEPLRWTRAR
jgi:allophanate hydrolase subunit 2